MIVPPETPTESPDAVDQQALDWLIRTRDGLTTGQARELSAWMASSPANRLAYKHWQAQWQSMDTISQQDLNLLRANWPVNKTKTPAARRHHYLPYAAGLAAAVCMTAGIYLALHTPEPALFTAHYASQPGQIKPVTLPDHSRIALDTATSIEVRQFADRRELLLQEGQALFDVQANPQRPFIIQAGDLRITVTGTRFSVRHTPTQPGQNEVRVAVASGHVRVERRPAGSSAWRMAMRGDTAVTLTAGQQLIAPTGSHDFHTASVSEADIAPWKESRLVFDDTPLGDILAEFARYGHAHPVLSSPRLASMRLTGTFNSHQPDAFYRTLPQVLPVSVEEKAGKYIIRPAG